MYRSHCPCMFLRDTLAVYIRYNQSKCRHRQTNHLRLDVSTATLHLHLIWLSCCNQSATGVSVHSASCVRHAFVLMTTFDNVSTAIESARQSRRPERRVSRSKIGSTILTEQHTSFRRRPDKGTDLSSYQKSTEIISIHSGDHMGPGMLRDIL